MTQMAAILFFVLFASFFFLGSSSAAREEEALLIRSLQAKLRARRTDSEKSYRPTTPAPKVSTACFRNGIGCSDEYRAWLMEEVRIRNASESVTASADESTTTATATLDATAGVRPTTPPALHVIANQIALQKEIVVELRKKRAALQFQLEEQERTQDESCRSEFFDRLVLVLGSALQWVLEVVWRKLLPCSLVTLFFAWFFFDTGICDEEVDLALADDDVPLRARYAFAVSYLSFQPFAIVVWLRLILAAAVLVVSAVSVYSVPIALSKSLLGGLLSYIVPESWLQLGAAWLGISLVGTSWFIIITEVLSAWSDWCDAQQSAAEFRESILE